MTEQLSYRELLNQIRNGDAKKTTGPKEKRPIAKQSEKKKAEVAAEREARGGDDTELVKFMKRAIGQMTGYCAETGLRTETKIYKYAINSVCHILSRQHCKSVQYHPLNWIELDPGFHVKFDKMSWEERERLGCWPLMRERLISIWEDLAPTERRHFPDSVRKFIEDNDHFK